MAKTNWQDPGTSPIKSPHVAGLQEAVGKIQEALLLQTASATNVVLAEISMGDKLDKRYSMYQVPEGYRNWTSSPTPTIKKNNSTVNTGFTIDYGGGAVTFDPPLKSGDQVTANFTYVIPTLGINTIIVGSVAPTNTNLLWLDIRTQPYILRYHNGNEWAGVNTYA